MCVVYVRLKLVAETGTVENKSKLCVDTIQICSEESYEAGHRSEVENK